MKRDGLLLDLFLHGVRDSALSLRCLQVDRVLRERALTMRRFVLTTEAAIHAAAIVSKAPEIVAYAQEFAIPPYPDMYIEYPAIPYWEGLTGGHAGYEADQRVGIAIVGGCTAYVLASVPTITHRVGLVPLEYRLYRPTVDDPHDTMLKTEFMDDLRDDAGEPPNNYDVFFWGGSLPKLPPRLWPVLREHHSVASLLTPLHSTPEFWARMNDSSAGDMRSILALILLLNQPSGTIYEEKVGHAQHVVARKVQPLLSYSRVHIKLDPLPHIRELIRGSHSGAHKRWHEVRGHFAHDRTARWQHPVCGVLPKHGHLPEWSEYRVNGWRCLKCGGLRWWREFPKGRGQRGLGTVLPEYAVEAKSH